MLISAGAAAVGGAAGAMLRMKLSVLNNKGSAFHAGTLAANAAGSLIMGAAAAFLSSSAPASAVLRSLICTGLCGALTTFSTFSFESFSDIREGHILRGIAYMAASLAVCLLSAVLGAAAAFLLKG